MTIQFLAIGSRAGFTASYANSAIPVLSSKPFDLESLGFLTHIYGGQSTSRVHAVAGGTTNSKNARAINTLGFIAFLGLGVFVIAGILQAIFPLSFVGLLSAFALLIVGAAGRAVVAIEGDNAPGD